MFSEKRQELNARLDVSRAAIDRLIATYNSKSPIMQIAELETLLIERRDALTELASLDDSFIEFLLRARQQS